MIINIYISKNRIINRTFIITEVKVSVTNCTSQYLIHIIIRSVFYKLLIIGFSVKIPDCKISKKTCSERIII